MSYQISIIKIKKNYSSYPLNIKISTDAKWTFVKLNKGYANKKTPNDNMNQYFIGAVIFY
nr:hypothetical protein [uncultured Flavobacterium sp.]